MDLFQILAVSTFILHSCSAQLFPFSNLRAFFDPKTKQHEVNNQSPSSANISRPHREADDDFKLPSLQEFDSPDIFAINRDIDNHRGPQVKRQPVSQESSTAKSQRRGSNAQYHSRIRPDETAQYAPEQDSTDSVFITPKPNAEYSEGGSHEDTTYSKIKSKSITQERKPPPARNSERSVESVEYGSKQINNGKENTVYALSPVDYSSKLTLPSEDSTFIKTVPSVGVNAHPSGFQSQDGLVDYLVPPKLPSVYERNFKRQKLRNPTISNLKSPPPTPYLKKNNRFRVKKHRHEVTSAMNAPLADRLAMPAKRQTPRRRPNHHRDLPVRQPVGNQTPVRQLELQQQAVQMDEQITAATGFTGAASHPHSSHGNERVEFQMHGQKGPNSYKFGYDTGKGHNRQFRFEEKDAHGHVKGHYGYYDKDGKLQLVNYEADPEHGFKAETV